MKHSDDEYYSEEYLNALVDREFPPEERAEQLHKLHENEEATRVYCQLRSVKEMVQATYELPESMPVAETKHRRWLLLGVAASLIFAVVLISLPVVSQLVPPTLERFALLDPDGRGAHPALAEDKEIRIVFHVVNSTRTNAAQLLGEVESVLSDYSSKGKKLRVEVVAHSAGLDLLRKKLSSERQRIAELSRNFPNLAFVACRNTVERVAISEGIEVMLLPQAELTESGVAHVVRRQQEGWIYIQV